MKPVSAKAAGFALAAIGLSLVVLKGCQGPGVVPDATSQIVHSAPGITLSEGSMRALGGCEYAYTLYRAGRTEAPADVVLAHGFLRDRERMADLARALANGGLTTVTLDLCNMRPWDGGHRENAAEMRRVADQLAVARPVYAGCSAGGLAAILAAADDPDVAGVLVLDLVDQADVGRAAAADLEVPVVGLFGEASRCNANLNGLGVIETVARGEVIRIPGATHCDFESPTDGLCRLVCVPEDRAAEVETRLRDEIIARAVEAASRIVSESDRTAAAPSR